VPQFLHIEGYEFSKLIERNPEKELFALPNVLEAVESADSCIDLDCFRCPVCFYGMNFHDQGNCTPQCDDWITTKKFLQAWVKAIKTSPAGQLMLF